MELHPGRGVSLVLNDDVVEFITTATHDVAYYFAEDEFAGKQLVHALVEEETTLTWCEEADEHSCQAFTVLAYKQGELRISIIVAPHGCKLDIRQWSSLDH